MSTRREFITLVGGAAAAWPLRARAQQREPMRRIGVLMNLAADDPEGQARVAAFLQGLQEAGWAVGRNAQIDIRWGMGDAERSRKNATELVAFTPDVVFATTFPTVAALQQAANAVPYRIRGSNRSGRRRFGRELDTAGRQHRRVCRIRIRPERQMV
jgi:putative ABC transport system substrate-binding protein